MPDRLDLQASSFPSCRYRNGCGVSAPKRNRRFEAGQTAFRKALVLFLRLEGLRRIWASDDVLLRRYRVLRILESEQVVLNDAELPYYGVEVVGYAVGSQKYEVVLVHEGHGTREIVQFWIHAIHRAQSAAGIPHIAHLLDIMGS